jgi:signal transduction histidine kinase
VRPYIATRQRLVEAERLAMLGKMAASLAHEIQNPVAAIRLHTQLIQTATPAETAEASASSLPVILSEAERIEGLVNQWMFLTRPEPPRTSWVNLHHELQRAMESMSPLAAHAGVVVNADVPSELPVIADTRRLRQVLGNLIQNAIQAMPNGGTIRIRGEVRGVRVQLSIADTGGGFSAEALRRFPELFFSEKEGGMGIGLSVAHEIVRAHNGSLTIANRPGDTGGAVVTIELPLAANPSAQLQNTPASSPGLTST